MADAVDCLRRRRAGDYYDRNRSPPPPPPRARDHKRRASPSPPPPYRDRRHSPPRRSSPPQPFKRSRRDDGEYDGRRGSPRGGYGPNDRRFGYDDSCDREIGGRPGPGYADESGWYGGRSSGGCQSSPPDWDSCRGGYDDASNAGITQRDIFIEQQYEGSTMDTIGYDERLRTLELQQKETRRSLRKAQRSLQKRVDLMEQRLVSLADLFNNFLDTLNRHYPPPSPPNP